MDRNLSRPFEIRADAIDGQKRAISATIATEAPVEVYDCASGRVIREVLLMNGVEIAAHVPLLTDHTREIGNMVGSVENIRTERDQLAASLQFANGSPQADSAWALYSQRHGRQVSVGYRVLAAEEIPAGKSRLIGGQQFTAPANQALRVVTRWRLMEVSLTPIGADPGAMTRSLPSIISFSKGTPMSTTLEIVGRDAGQMTFAQYAQASLSRRNLPRAENDRDAGRTAFSGMEGIAELSALVNAAIKLGFRNAGDVLTGLYQIQNTPNYLLAELGALSVHPRLGHVGRGESAPSVAFSVSSTGSRLARYGNQFCFDEQDAEDSRPLGLYQLALEEVGAACRRFVQDLLWAVLLNNPTLGDGVALFAADRGNLGSVELSDTNLDAAMGIIGNQTSVDENDDPIHLGLIPKVLVVSPEKFGAAKRLVRNMQTGDGDLIVRADSRLSTTGIVDPTAAEDAPLLQGNGKNWLLAATADQAPSLILAALNGRVEPTIRSYTLDQGQWGVGFDVSLSVAATAVDGKPLYWSAGQ